MDNNGLGKAVGRVSKITPIFRHVPAGGHAREHTPARMNMKRS